MSEEKEGYAERYFFNMESTGPDFRNITCEFTVPTLDLVLEQFKTFLNSCGFTYVDYLAAGNDGKEWVVDRDGTHVRASTDFEEEEEEEEETK